MHEAAISKPILPHPLYGIYILPHVSAASLFTEVNIHTPAAAQPALTSPFAEGCGKSEICCLQEREILQINPEQSMT